jgi:hypothetical protein
MQNIYTNESFEFEKQDSSPLEGELVFVKGAEDVLPLDFVAEVEACLAFKDPPLVPVNALGRSYFLALPHPYGAYSALQISGGGYVDNGIRSMRDGGGLVYPLKSSKTIKPLRADFEAFEAGGTSFVDDEGVIQVVYSKGILGTYTGSQGDLKVQKTHEIWERLEGDSDTLLVPKVIGKFVYNLPDGVGGAQTAVLMLVPNSGLRIDHDIRVAEMELLSLLDTAAQKDRAREILREEFPAKIQALGFGLAKVHDLGYSHNQTHLGNLATVVSNNGDIRPFIADWGTSRLPAEGVRLRAQTGDFAQMVISLIRWLQHLDTRLEIPAFWGAAKALSNSALQGYANYHNHHDPESLKIPAREMVNHAEGRSNGEDMIQFFGKVIASARSGT